VMCEYRCTRWV